MISEHATIDDIIAYGIEHQHMRTLKESAGMLVRQGITTPEEMLKITCG